MLAAVQVGAALLYMVAAAVLAVLAIMAGEVLVELLLQTLTVRLLEVSEGVFITLLPTLY
jgi:hypothetical protein